MKFSDRVFSDETIDLDGNEYYGCSFQRCGLRYSGGTIPHFTDCRFDAGSFLFDKGAGSTVEFLRELYHAGLQQNVEAFFEHIRKNPPGAAAP